MSQRAVEIEPVLFSMKCWAAISIGFVILFCKFSPHNLIGEARHSHRARASPCVKTKRKGFIRPISWRGSTEQIRASFNAIRMSDGSENWVLGVTLGLLGSIAINTGNNIQSLGLKNAQVNEKVAPDVEPTSPDAQKKQSIPWLSPKGVKTAPYDNDDEFSVVTVAKQGPLVSPTWIVGTVIFVSGSLLNFASYAFAAQSMLASLESVQFVTNLLFGKFMLGARVTQTMMAGTLLTVTGTIMAVQFSSKETLDLNTEDIKNLYKNPAYICYLFLMAIMLVVLHLTYEKLERLKQKDKAIRRSDIIMPCIYSVWSALFGTQSVVQAKILAELLAVHSSGEENIFASWLTYFTIVLWIMTGEKNLFVLCSLIPSTMYSAKCFVINCSKCWCG